ncbi:MAG: TRAM domain-containing protein, partial [Candidatus Omnitrophica bacterium]|nr:TRAM domain-containing protein [Candidatus Omnitrophota bacterium]
MSVAVLSMRIGQILELKIDSLAYGGEGVARRRGMVYFVADALAGERVEARIRSIQKKFVRAEAVKILEPSFLRRQPVCRHFGTCGGCVFQHLAYEGQLEAKRKMLEDLLGRLGGFKEMAAENTVASPQSRNYRNHITFLRSEGAREPRFGFVAKDNRTLIEVVECPIADARINAVISELRMRLRKLSPARKDRLKNIIVRVGTEGKAEEGWIQTGRAGIFPEKILTA